MEEIQTENRKLKEEMSEMRDEIEKLKQGITEYKEVVKREMKENVKELCTYIKESQKEMIKEVYQESMSETVQEMKTTMMNEVGGLLERSSEKIDELQTQKGKILVTTLQNEAKKNEIKTRKEIKQSIIAEIKGDLTKEIIKVVEDRTSNFIWNEISEMTRNIKVDLRAFVQEKLESMNIHSQIAECVQEEVAKIGESGSYIRSECTRIDDSSIREEENSQTERSHLRVMHEERSVRAEEIIQIKSEIDNIKSNLDRGTSTTILRNEIVELMREGEDKKRRESNLVLYNITETQEDATHVNDLCKKIFDWIIPNENPGFEIIRRLGKSTNSIRPRPILIKMENRHEKLKILKVAKKLRNATSHNLKNVVIAPDLTPREQEIDRELRRQLKEKKEYGQGDWCIYRGKLMNRAENFQLENAPQM